MRAIAVIGAGWGDEGKGLMTDYFASPDAVVCRFNGGAQAGHTVIRNGVRHVFSHFASGSLQGAATYLGPQFIFNPTLLLREQKSLADISAPELTLWADEDCRVTTPFDVMINMIAEEQRGDARHGSCGVGINETIKRNRVAAYRLQLGDDLSTARMQIAAIQKEWVPARLKALGIRELGAEWEFRLTSPFICERFLQEFGAAKQRVQIMSPHSLLHRMIRQNSALIFEGAQGLMLDQGNVAYHPHLTPSYTGVRNMIDMILTFRSEIDLDVVYCTRAYATRHGAGKFPRHDASLAYEDATNAPNPWQGSLRFGHLDLDILRSNVNRDALYVPLTGFRSVRKGLAITCMDQVGQSVNVWYQDKLHQMDSQIMADIAYEKVGAVLKYQSFGPTANDVQQI